MADIHKNVLQLEEKLNQSLETVDRKRSEVQVIAVTKSVSIELTKAIVQEGFRHLAENRPEGLALKQEALADQEISWHFIGNLQTRKVKNVINRIDYLHSLDRLSLAKEIEKRAEATISCFVQVNVSGEATKSGVHPDELDEFIQQLADYPKIKVIGLMTMAPLTADTAILRTTFATLKECQRKIAEKALSYAPCTELSMGMSEDYQIAVEEGATYIRVGTSLFKD
ncbi:MULTISPECIES: YggS family pyridoxal phosphate-dependent enzyme [Carnobacterium]|uniref:Pyridoxal phosphate homeostasis protein n=1 Tax=Carnobacterium antarcticum TaxID=2126436 RepID=A0ABW4NNA1_9LACT|nr:MULTISPECIES: YggS family pyridoxal phosphate-dependent enzyme [unclassified Carnobacterium]ALV20793.1 hypothetical protein NY10_170 [Carnobacterium sp. CP1]QQP70954.1 YggS family pyridoxal phosphate-dependent enzyme [Carnobacterium sp. CS13]